MRCDDVFEILTSGPFPAGLAADRDVETHLRSCHECRAFALALRPVEQGASDMGCPSYQGEQKESDELATDSALVQRIHELVHLEHLSNVASSLEGRAKPVRWGWSQLAAICAAASLLGAAAAFGGPLLTQQLGRNRPISTVNRLSLNEGKTHLSGCSIELLSTLGQKNPANQSVVDSEQACCLQCHGGKPQSGGASSQSIGLVVMSCQRCHQQESSLVRL